ncbi:MAG: hypothetical protein AAFQ94_26710 [Bacteroidota bacterium]
MARSIETIWKEGFLKSDTLVAPKLNNLYNQKSIHLIDQFKRRSRINMNALMISSTLFLIIFTIMGLPLMGVGYFLILTGIVIFNKKLINGLTWIDKGENSYEYLIAFDEWLKQAVRVNRKMAMFYYPLFFLSLILGLWYAGFNAREIIGEDLVDQWALNNPDLDIVLIINIVTSFIMIMITILFAYFGGRIYDWDKSISYGSLFNKLEEIVSDMEELRS